MKKGSLWLVSILLVLLGVIVYWDHGFKGFASMLDYATAPKICCFALLFIVCVYVETKLHDDKVKQIE